VYSEAEKDIIKKRIFEEMTGPECRSLDDILLNDIMGEFPAKDTVYRWLYKGGPDYDSVFSDDYSRARVIRADKLVDQTLELADEIDTATYIDKEGNKRTDWGKVNRNKTQISARQWAAARMAPKKYGDKIETTIQGGDQPLQTVDYSKFSPELLEELAKHADANKPKS
jgi:hypothetical protein